MDESRRFRQILLGLTVFSIPFAGYHVSTGVVSVSVTNILLLVSAVVIFLRLSFKGTLKITKSQAFVFTALSSIILIGSITTLNQSGSFRRFITLSGYLLLVVLLSVGIESRRELQQVIHVVFLSSVVVASLAIIASVMGFNFGAGVHNPRSIFLFSIPFTRTAGIPLSHGEFGMYTISTLPLYALYSSKSRDLTHLSGVGIILFTVLFILQSRSGWLALFAGFFVLLLLLRPSSLPNTQWGRWLSKSQKMGLVLAPIGGAALIWLIYKIGQSISLRVDQMITAVNLISAQPLGYGWGNIRHFFDRNAFPHNAFLRHGVESGLASSVALVLIFAVVLRDLVRVAYSTDNETHLLAAGLIAGLGAIFVEANNLIDFGKASWMWIGFGLAFYRLHKTPDSGIDGPE